MTYALHLDKPTDLWACNDIGAGVETYIPYMILCKVQWWLHDYLLAVGIGLVVVHAYLYMRLLYIYYWPLSMIIKEYCAYIFYWCTELNIINGEYVWIYMNISSHLHWLSHKVKVTGGFNMKFEKLKIKKFVLSDLT